jgi:glycosyltransferase involved in cell wall biosynthesis
MHPWAGLPARQALYAKLARHTGWRIRLLTATKWKDEYGSEIEATADSGLQTELIGVPVALSGNIPLHFFVAPLRRHIRDFAPDMVYIYHEPYAAATFQMLRAARAVVDVPVGVRSAQNLLKRYPTPFRQSEAYVYRHTDFAVVVSDNVAEVMRRKGYRRPLEVIPMPVDLSAFKPPTHRPDRTNEVLQVGFVGRLVPEKGADTAIRAIAETHTPQLRLQIIGSGPDEQRLRSLAGSLGVEDRISWLGALDREAVARAYNDMDLLVVPSRATPRWSEQFGRVVIEAAAAEVPAVVSRSGELPFLIASIGAGWIVGESDHKDLSAKLSALAAGRGALREAGITARRSVQGRFSDEAIVASLADAFSAARSRGRVCNSD